MKDIKGAGFDFVAFVYTDQNLTKSSISHQISDHYPLWGTFIELLGSNRTNSMNLLEFNPNISPFFTLNSTLYPTIHHCKYLSAFQ